ncbi:hypothetical protein CR513_45968, partial [Mucuna pruriens]
MYGTHIGGRALASKIARVGYYWPTLKTDCMNYVKKCDKCQRFVDAHKAPPGWLHSEVWEIAHIKEYAAKARAARKHDHKIVHRSFKA